MKCYIFWIFVVLNSSYVRSSGSPKRNTVRKMEGFIIGGVEIEIEQYPWLAQMTMYSETYCGGVVIGDRVILTAAHCIVNGGKPVDPSLLEVHLGSTYAYRGSKYFPCEVMPHENYNVRSKDYYFYDIGLILLKTEIRFSWRVKKATFIPSNEDFKQEHFTMSVAGWGFTDSYGKLSTRLKMTRMRYVSHRRCNNSQTSDGVPMPVPAHMFCLIADKWTSDCFGDSGSGVMWGNYLVGIVATGRDIACGSETMPSMYTDVTYFKDWITRHTKFLETRSIGSCKPSFRKKKLFAAKDEFEEQRQHNEVIHETGSDFYHNLLGISLIPRHGRS